MKNTTTTYTTAEIIDIISSLNVKDLHAMAKSHGLKGYSRLKKANLIIFIAESILPTVNEAVEACQHANHTHNDDVEAISPEQPTALAKGGFYLLTKPEHAIFVPVAKAEEPDLRPIMESLRYHFGFECTVTSLELVPYATEDGNCIAIELSLFRNPRKYRIYTTCHVSMREYVGIHALGLATLLNDGWEQLTEINPQADLEIQDVEEFFLRYQTSKECKVEFDWDNEIYTAVKVVNPKLEMMTFSKI